MKKRLLSFLLVFVLAFLCGCTSAKKFVPKLEVYCFSAGKADSFLLYTEKSAVLIDTGESNLGDTVLEFLKEKGITELDCMIITHFDKDHVGSAAKIINGCETKTVLQSNYEKDSDEYKSYVKALSDNAIEAKTVREEYTFTLDSVQYTVNPPAQEEYEKNPSNNSSLIVSVSYGKTGFLFMGDAQKQRIKEFLEVTGESYDFLKVPYHGEWQGKLDDLIAQTKPSCAVITSSDTNREDSMTLNVLKQNGAKTFLTRTAPVLIQSDGEKLRAEYVDM